MKHRASTQTIAAIVIGIAGTALMTTLLIAKVIGEGSFCILEPIVALVALAIYLAERLREFSLKDLKITLAESQQKVVEARELYSKIDHLQKATMKLDAQKMAALGLKSRHLSTSGATMRFPVGCIKRERERLARIFAESRSPQQIAQAILDDQLDDQVFKWNGPEIPLDAPPTSVAEREAVAAAQVAKQ